MPKCLSLRTIILAAVTVAGACTVHDQPPPPLTGPSEFGLSLRMEALPDTLTIGGPPSTIVITARNNEGSAAPNVQLRLDMLLTVGGVVIVQDLGTLSTKTLVTGSDGRASAIYSPPPLPAPGYPIITNLVTIVASLVGTNQQWSALRAQTVDIRLVFPSFNNPAAPVAFFTYSPTAPKVNQEIFFSAVGSYPVTGSSLVNYAWIWGDGTSDLVNTSPNEDHDYVSPGTYYVTLTVTDNLGQQGSSTQPVVVLP